MKRFLLFMMISILVLPASVSGEFMFTVDGNAPTPNADLDNFEQLIEEWFYSAKVMTVNIELEFYAKVDAFNTSTTAKSYIVNPPGLSLFD